VSRRHFSILLAVTVVAALAVALLIPQDAGKENGEEAGLLLPGVEERINSVTEVSIQGGAGVDVTLRRAADHWAIVELAGYPADFDRLRQLLADLAQASVLEPKTDNPAYYERLGVQDPSEDAPGAVKVALGLGEQRPAVIVGKTASGRDGQYVRREGEARSLLIDRELEVPTEPVEWAVREVANVVSGDVAEVEIIHPDGSWILASKPSAAATDFVLENLPDGREVISSWTVNSLGGALASLRMDSVAPASGEAPEEAVRFRLLTFPGIEYTGRAWQDEAGHWIRIGSAIPAADAGHEAGEPVSGGAGEAATDDADLLAESEAFNRRVSGWSFLIPEYKYANLTKRLDQLLKPTEQADPPGEG